MKRLRLLTVWAAFLAMAAVTPLRAEEPVRGGTLTVAETSDSKTLDPVRSNDLSERNTMYLIYNTLVQLQPDFSIGPELATSWELTNDNKRIVFHLRSGVKFHDGTPFDASVVKWNFDHRLDPAAKSPWRVGLEKILVSVEVIDPQTVAINLKTPAPDLLGLLGQREGMMISPAAAQKYGDDFGGHPVGTGPFVFKEWVRGNHITVERNPNYWEPGKPYLDRIVVANIATQTIGIQRLITGEADAVTRLTPQDIRQLQGRNNIVTSESPPNRWISLQWQVDKPPFNNEKLRQAIAYAIDRKKIGDIVMLGKATIANAPTPPGLWWSNPDVPVYDYNPEKAKALLKEANAPSSLTMTVQTLPMDQQIGQLVQENLKAVGLTLNLEPVSNADFYARVVTRAINFTVENWTQRTDADGLIRLLFRTGEDQNTTGYSNPEVDSLIDKARTLEKPADRKPLYDKIQSDIARDLPYISLFFQVEYAALRNNVHGFVWIPDQIPRYRDLWKTK